MTHFFNKITLPNPFHNPNNGGPSIHTYESRGASLTQHTTGSIVKNSRVEVIDHSGRLLKVPIFQILHFTLLFEIKQVLYIEGIVCSTEIIVDMP